MRHLLILALAFQAHHARHTGFMTVMRHLGAPGSFLVGLIDSSPIPTPGLLDILVMVLAARHVDPWYLYAAAATLGSVVGAYLVFRLARGAGAGYLQHKFGERRVNTVLTYFRKWGTAMLLLSCLIPFPLPTSAFFAAAGVLNYPLEQFLVVVTLSRAGRYFALAALAYHYGRGFIRIIRHPGQHLTWVIIIACVGCAAVALTIYLQRKLSHDRGEAA